MNWIITNLDTKDESGQPAYWSNQEGWVTIYEADVYDDKQKADNPDLPIGRSEWIEYPKIEELVHALHCAIDHLEHAEFNYDNGNTSPEGSDEGRYYGTRAHIQLLHIARKAMRIPEDKLTLSILRVEGLIEDEAPGTVDNSSHRHNDGYCAKCGGGCLYDDEGNFVDPF